MWADDTAPANARRTETFPRLSEEELGVRQQGGITPPTPTCQAFVVTLPAMSVTTTALD